MKYIDKIYNKIVSEIDKVKDQELMGQKIKFTDVPDKPEELDELMNKLKEKYPNINFKIKVNDIITNVTWLYKDKVTVKNINE